jgi:hypothetical protein
VLEAGPNVATIFTFLRCLIPLSPAVPNYVIANNSSVSALSQACNQSL